MAAPKIFPVPNSTLPYWRSELHEIDSHRSTEHLPAECDIIIIGAGFSGVSTAYHLLDENPFPPSIVILEAREICSGATGRNGKAKPIPVSKTDLLNHTGGHLMMCWPHIDPVTKLAGPEAAKELSLFQAEQVYAIKGVVEKEKLDCDLILTRCFETMLDQSQADKMKEIYDKQLQTGLDYIRDVNFIGPKHVERVKSHIYCYCRPQINKLTKADFWRERRKSSCINCSSSIMALQVCIRTPCEAFRENVYQRPDSYMRHLNLTGRERQLCGQYRSWIYPRTESCLRNECIYRRCTP